MGVVVFAKVQGQVKFESPRTRRVRGLSYFANPRTFVKTTPRAFLGTQNQILVALKFRYFEKGTTV